ncbi:hypothetical protein MUS1_08560 [Marinomonas ushuaiensis DSM 15871]|uniref:Uncharacterized protein n=1 Tax=Marinomonas ushuaiensis DSM 15871 TaxID=1122207 RepID=X7E2U7_9GAMM|nr:hypothetical protein [Marinomonas ushuaiensis]ETX09466.1 hypothetical protein MUS1_08560 [Marinomonas ushuaiensis DSM 15871]
MSDLAAHHENDALEPDEETLISALRNQDDIPILMDIVAEQVAACASQEDYLVQTLDESDYEKKSEVTDTLSSDLSQELIAKTITSVLERRLPELVSEVIQTLYSSDATIKKD